MTFVGDFRAVVRGRDFRRLYATRLTSQAADGVFQVALAGYTLFSPEKQTTPAKTAATFAVLLLPYSVVGPFAGVLIDRWSRQRILAIGNGLRSVLVLGVASLVAAGVDDVPLYVGALTVLSINRFFLSALSAALPHVVPDDELVMANSVSTTSGTLAAVFGAGMGYLVRLVAGTDGPGLAVVMTLAAVMYLISGTVATTMTRELLGPDFAGEPPQTIEAIRRVARGLVDGAKHVWHHRHPGYALLAIASHRFFYGLSTISLFLLYKNYFTDDGWLRAGLTGLGQVVVAATVGVFVAAAVTPAATRRMTTDTWIVANFALAAVVEVALGFPFSKLAFLPAAFLLGFVAQASKICVDTIVQTSIDDAYRGRVFSFYDVLFNVSFVSAAAVGAVTLPESGKSYVVLGGIAVGYALTALTYAALTTRQVGDVGQGRQRGQEGLHGLDDVSGRVV